MKWVRDIVGSGLQNERRRTDDEMSDRLHEWFETYDYCTLHGITSTGIYPADRICLTHWSWYLKGQFNSTIIYLHKTDSWYLFVKYICLYICRITFMPTYIVTYPLHTLTFNSIKVRSRKVSPIILFRHQLRHIHFRSHSRQVTSICH